MRGSQILPCFQQIQPNVFGANAIPAGLADAVGTFESAVADFSSFLSSRSRKPPQARSITRTEAASSQKEHEMQEQDVVPEMIGVDAAAVLVAEARREVTQAAQAIAELCLIANVPDKAAEFIAAGKSQGEVRRVLIDARAAQSDATDIRSTITVDAGTQSLDRPETSPIVAAVKKLTAQA